MQNKKSLAKLSAARIVASLFGVLAGLGGMTHGVGEVLQGNVAPEGIAINSWTQGPIATNMGGEPGITLVPNLLLTGLLTLLVSLSILLWATRYVHRKNGGRILILLSIVMLLVGGGIGPPLIGILAGVARTAIGAPLSGWRSRLPLGAQHFLAALWPWLFAVAAISGFFLVVGSLILVYFFGLNDADLFLNTFYFTVLSLLLTVLLAPLFDNRQRERGAAILN
jgi:hypothetical protein